MEEIRPLPAGQEFPTIVNLVATFKLGVKTLPLQELSRKLKNCEYNPRVRC